MALTVYQAEAEARREAELDRAVQEIGANAVAVRADSSNLADLDRLYELVKDEAGKPDFVENGPTSPVYPLG